MHLGLRPAQALMMLAVLLTGCKAGNPAENTSPARAAEPAVQAFHVDPATAGTITGTVKFAGARPKPKVIDMSSDPTCAKLHPGGKVTDAGVIVNSKGGLADAFVYVSKGLEGKTFATPAEAVKIDQAGCMFRPHVEGIQTGQTLDIVNSDPVTHNIHTMGSSNRDWNHSQGPGDPEMHRKFTHAEIMVPVKCNIHDWMHAWIGVVDHPYFATTGDDGSFTLKNLPPGSYTVTAWHDGFATEEAEVTVPPSGKAETTLTFHGK